MNQTKTAVILSIITLVLVGVVLYALRDNFKSDEKKVVTSKSSEE